MVRPGVGMGAGAARGKGLRRSIIALDTLVTVELPDQPATPGAEQLAAQALGWFSAVEATCSRFDASSELSRLSASGGREVPVSELLYRALEFAVAVAEASAGAFDPTVGAAMARRGFDRNFRTGERLPPPEADPAATYRDIVLGPTARTVRLQRPIVLDLGALAKGLALDLAAEALGGVGSYAIFAGGDLRVHGRNGQGESWRIGIRHPRAAGELIDTITVDEGAVCTSGDYERQTSEVDGHHILSPETGESARSVLAATVVASTALVADALATAAFVLGPRAACSFLEAQGVDGLVVYPGLRLEETRGFGRHRL